MKKNILLITFSIFFSHYLMAQGLLGKKTHGFWLGAKVGIGAGRDGHLALFSRPNSYLYKPTFSAGFMLGYQNKKGGKLELDLLYNYRGVGVLVSTDNYASLYSHNIDIPLLISIPLDKKGKYFVQAGPQVSVHLAVSEPTISDEGKKKYEDEKKGIWVASNFRYPFNSVEFPLISRGEVGLVLGLLYKPKPNFGIDLRYTGMTKYEYTDRLFMLSGNYYF